MNYILISIAILTIAAICLYQVWRNVPLFLNHKTGTFIGFTASKRRNACGQNNIVIGKDLDDVPQATGNDSTQLGVNNTNHSECGIGYFEPFHNIGSKDAKIKFSKS